MSNHGGKAQRGVVMTAGTQVLRAMARTSAGPRRNLLNVGAQGGKTDEEWEGGFPGVLKSPQESEAFVKAVDDFAAQTNPDDRFHHVVELRALKAVEATVRPGTLVLLGADTTASRLAAYALGRLIEDTEWEARWSWYDLGLDAQLGQARGSLGELHKVFAELDAEGDGPPLGVFAGGYNNLIAALTLFSFMSDIELAGVAGVGDTAELVPWVRSDAAGELSAVPSLDDVAGAAARGFEAIRRQPHEIRVSRAGRHALASTEAMSRMERRTRRWVEGDVWQADRLPQIVHHGVEHGRRVDSLSNEILRRSSLLEGLAGQARDLAVEALSAASWLHDVGQRGGALPPHFVTDSEHVRLFHGLLTREVLGAYPAEFDVAGELGALTGELCARHQRLVQLDNEPPRGFKGCSAFAEDAELCPVCCDMQILVKGDTMRQVFEEHERRGEAFSIPLEVAAKLGAVLRVADAADIGVHRVNGRWSATNRHSIEDIWRSNFAHEIFLEAQARGCPNSSLSALDLLVLDGTWPANVHANAVERLRSKPGFEDLAQRLTAYRKFLIEQITYVAKHKVFAGSRVVDSGGGTFGLVLVASELWVSLDESQRRDWFDEAACYIWEEYEHSEIFFGTGDVSLPFMEVLQGPDGLERRRGDVAQITNKANTEKRHARLHEAHAAGAGP